MIFPAGIGPIPDRQVLANRFGYTPVELGQFVDRITAGQEMDRI